MKTIKNIVLTTVAAFALSACAADTANKPAANVSAATTNTNAAKPAAAAPTKDALMTLEKQGWDAWKSGDMTAYYNETVSDKYTGFNSGKRVDKAAALAATKADRCDVKSYSVSDDQMNMIGSDVAVLSFKAAQDGTCAGKKIPAEVWSTSVYVREGDKWKNVYYSENAVTDAKSPTPKPAAPIAASAEKPDAMTDAMMKVETAAWDAWKNRDVKAIEGVMAKDFLYVSGRGRQDRAGAVKGWSEPKCEGLAYTFAEPKSVPLTPDVAFVTYKADVKGTCDGKAVAPTLWVASFDIKEGDEWKNAFYTDINR
jgi:ketosteroid isomerase-like protein